ncbi:MAG: metal ABC transporter substrate-binding protein [Lachnospiraceae bacterium]|nr:metal ABC transporter substrate-binding protein [Lachnospiraceae bacterium]
MKKYISFFAAVILTACSLLACQNVGDGNVNNDDNLKIVTTIFPEYDWVMNILGENPAKAEVTLLLDKGVDLHNYQPTAQDIVKISECDVFVYVGGESDEWVEDVLKEANNKDMQVINLMEVLGDSVKEEEAVEGMQEESEHDHEHADEEESDEEHEHENDGESHDDNHEEDGNDEEHEHHDEIEYDEHVWLSLRNATILTERISESIQKADPANAGAYKNNTNAYVNELKALDEEYKKIVAEGSKDTLVFGDRFPFRYMVDDYGLNYYAAFAGCSTETEASFETIIFLAEKMDELSLHAILTIEGNNKKIAETIVSNTESGNQQILVMDSMQSKTSQDVQNGATYLSIMKDNLLVLKEAMK